MKFFAKVKELFKKMIVAICIVISLGMLKPDTVQAVDNIGGLLMEPICTFIVFLGDSIIDVAHTILVKQDLTLVQINLKSGFVGKLKIFAAIVVGLMVVALAGVVTLGIGSLLAATTIGSFFATGLTASIIGVAIKGGFFVGGMVYNYDGWDEEVNIPVYSISPEEVFQGRVPMLNVNFFSPPSAEDYIIPCSNSIC